MRCIISILIILFWISVKAQPKFDSIWNVWLDTTQTDSIRLASINKYTLQKVLFSDPDSAFVLLQTMVDYAEKVNNKKWLSSGKNSQGISLQIRGDYFKAIKYYNESLAIAEAIGNEKQIAGTLNNIGIIYREQKNFDKALDYFLRSYKIKKSIGDRRGAANSLGNLGGIYASQQKYNIALDYYYKGLKVQEEIGEKRIIAGLLNNIGSVHMSKGDYVKAEDYYQKGLDIREEIGDLRSVASSVIGLGRLSMELKDYRRGIEYNQRAYEIAKKVGLISELSQSSKHLYTSYKALGNEILALKYLEEYILNKDSIGSDKNKQEIVRQEFKYQYEKQHLADSLEFIKKEELKEIEHQTILKQEQNQRYILYGGILFLILLAGVTYRSYNQKKKNNIALSEKNNIITMQKEIVEEKNQEITDSINYAKRIQNAILPQDKVVKEYLKDSFVFYRPKDIVAGDFYWLEQKNDSILFAAADCTGHGVPGAMVSVICNNGLNRSVREYGLTDPGKILDKTREIVIEEFEKSEEDVKDGMDIALCSLNENTLKFAGAHNPLWIIRNGVAEIEEIKANKQPIGKFYKQEPYKTHTIELQKGDSIYIFSDGYADQFGGEKDKKLTTTKFKKLLLSFQDQSMSEQKELISEAFDNWKGSLEQLDDVCVIGVRI